MPFLTIGDQGVAKYDKPMLPCSTNSGRVGSSHETPSIDRLWLWQRGRI
jgi:hypothetical protein